jgi:hypothetical protein
MSLIVNLRGPTSMEVVLEHDVPHNMGPEHDSALYEMGVEAFQHRKIEVALEFVSRACAMPKAPGLYHRTHAEILRRSGRLDAAEATARLAVECGRDCAQSWETLGSILVERGKLAESCECYATAVQI